MPALPTRTDVLIVGAGPSGLALALSLAQLGVDHVLIDRNDDVQPGTKAAALQPATMEYLDRLGVAADLVAAGDKGPGFQLRNGQRTLVRVSYDELDTPFPYQLLLPQQATEEHLASRLTGQGGTVHRGHRLLSFSPDFPGVTATIAAPDGTVRAVYARYIVGCDGVHSQVRAAAGIPFPGDAREQLYAVADVRLGETLDAADRAITAYLSPKGMLLTSPMGAGLFRIVAIVPPGSAAPTAADLETLLKTRGQVSYRIAEVAAAATYRVQERLAERMSDGPVFLAGDAAHVHSPAGAQGFNTGVLDSANLGWKLHAVLAGSAPHTLLDTYHRERHPVAARLVPFTGQIRGLSLVTDPRVASVRDDVMTAAAANPGLTRWLAAKLAQFDVSYAPPGAARAQGAGGPYQAGHRVPPTRVTPDRLNWILAVPKTEAAPADGGQHGNLTVRVSGDLDATLLIRPDGYLAASGVPADPSAALERLGDYAQGTGN